MRGTIEISGADVILKVASVPEDIQTLVGKDCDIEVKLHREKRSLDSNAYFHVLCDKLRLVLGVTKAEVKTWMICSYGQLRYVDDVPVVYETNIPPETMIKDEYQHLSCVREDEKGIYTYIEYRGSHTYDSAEMSKLIEGTISECKELGIETATPDELAQMALAWEEKHGQEKDR